jgi:hypothetical protein
MKEFCKALLPLRRRLTLEAFLRYFLWCMIMASGLALPYSCCLLLWCCRNGSLRRARSGLPDFWRLCVWLCSGNARAGKRQRKLRTGSAAGSA